MSLLTPVQSPLRWVVVPAVLVAAAAHLPVIAPHLVEARYMGLLFIVLTSACVLLGATLISTDPPVVYLAAAVTCGVAMLGYVLTRSVAFPMLGDEVGNWFEPLGVVSMLAEAVVVVSGVAAWHASTVQRTVTDPATAAA